MIFKFLAFVLILSLFSLTDASLDDNTNPSSPLFSLAEAAVYLKVTDNDIQQLIDSGEITPLKIGFQTRIHKNSLDQLVQRSVSSNCASISVSDGSFALPQFLENYYYTSTASGISGFVVPYCQFIDLNGDGLPDYVCSFSYGGTTANGQYMNCLWRNTGSGWALFP